MGRGWRMEFWGGTDQLSGQSVGEGVKVQSFLMINRSRKDCRSKTNNRDLIPSERIALPQMSRFVDSVKSKAWRQIHKNMKDMP
jgi:hypothetical protein